MAPKEIAPHLEHFIGPWCVALRPIRDDIEKEHAFLGLCAMLRLNPSVQTPHPPKQTEFSLLFPVFVLSVNNKNATLLGLSGMPRLVWEPRTGPQYDPCTANRTKKKRQISRTPERFGGASTPSNYSRCVLWPVWPPRTLKCNNKNKNNNCSNDIVWAIQRDSCHPRLVCHAAMYLSVRTPLLGLARSM
jgi:hypothetical protein